MLMTVEDLRKYIATEETDEVLAAKLSALELTIRRYTNHNFQNRGFRATADIRGSIFIMEALQPFEVGDTVQVSESSQNGGLFTVKEATDSTITVNEKTYDENDVLLTKVEYPLDVKLGAVNILKWQLRNEAAASGDKSAMPVQSETISRHSVTYATDATEADMSTDFGVPKKLVAFLKGYKRARF